MFLVEFLAKSDESETNSRRNSGRKACLSSKFDMNTNLLSIYEHMSDFCVKNSNFGNM